MCVVKTAVSLIMWTGNTLLFLKTEASVFQLPVVSVTRREEWGATTLRAHKAGSPVSAQNLPMLPNLNSGVCK